MGILDHVQLHYVDTLDKALAFKTWLGERRRVLGVDTETGGFTPENNRLRLVQFGDLNQGWAIPFERWGGLVAEALAEYDEPMVLHNSKFDIRFLTYHLPELKAWKWHLTNDTLSMSHLMDPLRPAGLKPLSARLVDPKAAAAQRLLDEAMAKNKWTWDTVPLDFQYYWVYAAMDPVLTCYIYEKLADHVEQSYKMAYDLELGATRVAAGMEALGARIDPDYCRRKIADLISWGEQARVYLKSAYGIANPGSSAQVLRALDAHNVDYLKKRTASGQNQALDKEVFESIDHEIGLYVTKIKHADKMRSSYLENFLEMHDQNFRLHPTIWTNGARTGRMSITNPALQTLFKGDSLIRGAFIPSEGNVLITIDADQIELRMMAHFSQDPGLIEAFLSGGNFFINISSEIFGRTVAKSDPEYGMVKTKVYAGQYGAGVEKMAKSARISVEKMQQIENSYNARFPGVKRFQHEIQNIAQRRLMSEGSAYILTPYGRKLMSDDGKDYTLTNYLLQGHAAEVLKRGMINIDAAGIGQYLILPVHDELVLDVPREEAQEVLQTLEEVLNDTVNYAVPLTWGGDILDGSWGSKYDH
jgi:DNA polymerase-1